MKIKRLFSIFLLLFILLSISFLIYKELIQKNHSKATEIQNNNKSKNFTTSLQRQSSQEKKVNTIDKITTKTSRPQSASTFQGAACDCNPKVIAYYFHGTHRCTTCLTIERYSREAIEKYFSKELTDKKIEFIPLNVEEPENRHYIQDYQLYTRSLVITLRKGDKEIEWKNLTDVWSYVRDKDKFYQYVKDETESFLKE